MEGGSAEIQAEVNHTEVENMKGDTDSAKGGDSKVGKKRRRSELPSPTLDRPTRERKSIERLIVSPDKEIKEFKIPKGAGTPLKDIPNIVFKLSKRRGADEAVQTLHRVLFGKSSKHAAKGNILKFSGFVWSGNEEKEKLKIKEKLEKVVKETLFQMSDLLDLHLSKGLKKEEGVIKVLEFLEAPHKTTDKLAEANVKVKKSKKVKKKSVKGAKKARTPGKSPKGKKRTPKKKQSSDEEDLADSEDAAEASEEVEDEPEEKNDNDYDEKKKSTTTRKRKRKSLEEESMKESEDEEEASPKKSRVQKEKKRSTPKAKKEKKTTSKAQKAKEPSDEDLKAAICELLQNADFSKVTFTDVMKQLGDKFKADLTHKKSHLKALIQEEIARLVGEGDNEDEDSNTEGDDDEEKPSGEQKDQEDDSRDGPKEDEEDGDGVVEDSDVEDDEDGKAQKAEKADDEDADEELNSEEDKAEGTGEDKDAHADGGDEEAEGASTDAA